MTIEDIVKRCSKFSGFNLTATIEGCTLTVKDESDTSIGHQSLLVVVRTLTATGREYLGEAYGRMCHWDITPAEKRVIIHALGGEIPQEGATELGLPNPDSITL